MDHNATAKVCSKCRQPQALSEFRSNRQKKDGLHPQCKACEREYALANKERIDAYQQEYREQNKPRLYAEKAEYRKRNAERLREGHQRWVAANPERVREGKRRCYEAKKAEYKAHTRKVALDNPERTRSYKRAWAKRNPAKVQELRMRYNAQKVAATIETVDYEAIYRRDKGICHICQNPVPRSRLHFDHVIPLSKGGPHSMENIKVSHARCNMRKGNR